MYARELDSVKNNEATTPKTKYSTRKEGEPYVDDWMKPYIIKIYIYIYIYVYRKNDLLSL